MRMPSQTFLILFQWKSNTNRFFFFFLSWEQFEPLSSLYCFMGFCFRLNLCDTSEGRSKPQIAAKHSLLIYPKRKKKKFWLDVKELTTQANQHEHCFVCIKEKCTCKKFCLVFHELNHWPNRNMTIYWSMMSWHSLWFHWPNMHHNWTMKSLGRPLTFVYTYCSCLLILSVVEGFLQFGTILFFL